MMRRIRLLLLVFPLLAAGCWNAHEVNDLAIITAAGVDLTEDGQIEMSVKIIYLTSPSGGDSSSMSGQPTGDKGTSVVRSVTGINMADAASRLQKEISRKVFWGQTDVFLFGERMARAGLEEPLDFLLRHIASRERAHVFVSDSTAMNVLKLSPPIDRSVADALVAMADQQTGLNISMKDLAHMMVGKSKAAVLPIVLIHEGIGEQQSFPFIQGAAVIKNGKMIGRMDEDATRGVMWLRNEIKQATVTVSPDHSGGYVSLHLHRSHTRLLPKIEGGRWIMTVRITGQDDIVENTTELDLSEPDHLGKVEKELEEIVNERVKQALDQAQNELRADIFQFADAFYRKYPKIWKANEDRWDEIFPKVDVRLETELRIARPGLIGKNFFKQEQR
jgi:germination protein, Ger(x)C family